MATQTQTTGGRKLLFTLAALAAVVTVMVVAHYRSRPERYSREGVWTAGLIPYRFTVPSGALAAGRATKAFDRAEGALAAVNAVMSVHLDGSELSRLNAAWADEPLLLSEDLWYVLDAARRFTEESGGAFDPTGRAMFQLWAQAGQARRLPDEAELAEARGHVGWDKLTLDGLWAMKLDPDLQIDLGGIAKGYAIDWALEELRKSGAVGGLVEVGGDLAVFGQAPGGGAWRVGVVDPFDPDGPPCGVLTLTDAGVATSGNYRRFTLIEGRRYSHIIDPRTGRPVDEAPSVTVIAPDALTADAWATGLSVLGPAGLAKIEQSPGVEAMLVTGTPEDHQVHYSSGFQRFVDPQNPIRLGQ